MGHQPLSIGFGLPSSYFWVAESDNGYRTTAFMGGKPGDPWAARTALAAAHVIDADIAAKPHKQERRAVLAGLKSLRPRIIRRENDVLPTILCVSRPGDGFGACVMARDGNTWIGDIVFGEDETEAADKAQAAFLRQAPNVSNIEFSAWEPPSATADSGIRFG